MNMSGSISTRENKLPHYSPPSPQCQGALLGSGALSCVSDLLFVLLGNAVWRESGERDHWLISEIYALGI